jgi:hypothetical protein
MAFCILLFVYWIVIGLAATASLSADRSPLRNLLLAPTVGVSLTSLPLVILNRWGVPVRSFGAALAVVLLLAALAALWRVRRVAPGRLAVRRRPLLAFCGVALFALLLTGRPMLRFGFDWVSFCNDDMANYSAGAQRFYDRGFYDLPTADDLVRGTYYPADYWFLHVGAVARAGSELIIAWAHSWAPLTMHQIFMPLILAFHLAMLWALGGLLLRPERPWVGWPQWRRKREAGHDAAPADAALPETADNVDLIDADRFAPAVIAAAAAAASPLLNLGTLYQLVAQAIGLAMICAMLALTCRPLGGLGRGGLLRHGVLLALMGAALMVLYPEVAPFVAVALGGYTAWGLVRLRLSLWPTLSVAAVAAAGALLLLNTYVIEALKFLVFQVGGTASVKQDVRVSLFPYYMVPKGLADLWGFLPLATPVPEPMLSVAIIAGAALLVTAAATAVVLGWRGEPVAIMLVVMLGVTFVMFQNRAGFPLYKLAMYVQPFLLGTLTLGWVTIVRAAARRHRRAAGEAADSDAPARRQPFAFRAASRAPLLVAAGLAVLAVLHTLNDGNVWSDPRRFYRLSHYPYTLYWLPIAAALVIALLARRSRRRAAAGGAAGPAPFWLAASAPMLAIALLGMPTQGSYLRSSTGVGSTFVEIPLASGPPGINREFRALLDAAPGTRGVVSDTFNIVLAKFQGMYTTGRVTSFPGNLFFRQIESIVGLRGQHLPPAMKGPAMALLERQHDRYPAARFDLHDPDMPGESNPFNVRDLGLLLPPEHAADAPPATRPEVDRSATLLVQTVGRQNILNRWYYPPERTPENLRAVPVADARNHLIFIASQLGQAYFDFSERGLPPSLYQIENDPLFFKGGSMSAVGRYLLLQAVNPSPRARLVLSFTSSYNANGDNHIPAIAVVGDERQPLHVTGRGSARLFSAPLRPQVIAGRTYYLIDMHELGRQFPTIRTGMMNLFGTDVPLDRRIVTGFARDISLISDEAFQAATPPSELSHFGTALDNDFRNPRLEYSGFYEDGWASEAAYVRLLQPAGATMLHIRGTVPPLGDNAFTTDMTVYVEGKAAGTYPLRIGGFDVKVPVDPAPATPGERREVRLGFSRHQKLPGADGRPVACLISRLGFDAPPPAPSRIEKFPDDLADPNLKLSGLYADGWLPRVSSVVMSQLSDGGTLVLRGRVPKIDDDGFKTEVVLSIDGKEIVRRTVGLDRFEMRVPLTTAAGRHKIDLTFSEVQTLPDNDGRSVGAMLELLAFEPAAPVAGK